MSDALPGERENTVFGVLFAGLAAGMSGLLLAQWPPLPSRWACSSPY